MIYYWFSLLLNLSFEIVVNTRPFFKRSLIFYPFSNMYYQAYCDMEKEWFACLERTTFRCMSEEKIREWVASEREDFGIVEQNLRNNGFKFSFAECSKIRSNWFFWKWRINHITGVARLFCSRDKFKSKIVWRAAKTLSKFFSSNFFIQEQKLRIFIIITYSYETTEKHFQIKIVHFISYPWSLYWQKMYLGNLYKT